MRGAGLDDVFWEALTTRQAGWALGGEGARRYPEDVAPFVGVASGRFAELEAARGLARAGETLYLVGVEAGEAAGWDVEGASTVAQMVFRGPVAPDEDDEGVEVLGPADAVEMLALMGAVYPGYYRQRTRELGLYVGVRRGGRLVAMAGQRMCLDWYREISAVATLPEHRGRGHAGRLVGRLVREILAEGLAPFLHVDADNDAARAAYEKAGFAWRRDLTVIKVRRRDD